MFTRSQAQPTSMKQEDFTKAFIYALKNEDVAKQLKAKICDELHLEIKELRETIKLKDKRIEDLETQVKDLHATTDRLEQYSRRNSLRVFGLAENVHEDPAKVALTLIKDELGVEVGVIDRAHRVGKKDNYRASTRPLLIKFATYKDRDAVYRAKKRLKGKNIFINEDLTSKRANLLFKARRQKRDGNIKDCWTHDGQILIKNKHGLIQSINDEGELLRSSE